MNYIGSGDFNSRTGNEPSVKLSMLTAVLISTQLHGARYLTAYPTTVCGLTYLKT
jgi:hypothetical protein